MGDVLASQSRWLLAPFYVGLVVTLLMLLLKAAQELFHFVAGALWATEADIIVCALSLADLTLTGSLIVIIIFSGYENFRPVDASSSSSSP
jgi:uncharacterized protein (TIGR00645 family)